MALTPLQKVYRRKGYVIIRNALSREAVANLRRELPEQFARLNKKPLRYLQARDALKCSLIYTTIFNRKIVEACVELFGNPYEIVNDLVVQQNVFSEGTLGWHTDCQSEIKNVNGAKYLSDIDYKFAKCGVYLQDNSHNYGGGIDLIPYAHWVLSNRLLMNYKIYKRFAKPVFRGFKNPLPVKAGDAVIFDCRMPHKSSNARALKSTEYSSDGLIDGIPEAQTKYVLYWEVCENGNGIRFVENSRYRAQHEETKRPKDTNRPRCGYLSLRYPEDYPADFVKLAETAPIRMFSLDNDEARYWKKYYDEVTGIVE